MFRPKCLPCANISTRVPFMRTSSGNFPLFLCFKSIGRAIAHCSSTFQMENTSHTKFGRICVFCGSSPGSNEVFTEAAIKLGEELVSQGINLVYGGGSLGLMGVVAKAVHNGGCHVIGICPEQLAPFIGDSIGELEIVKDMHPRKARMMELADAYIALPGGYGTLDELFEVLCLVQLGIHSKPVGLLNVNGFYDPILLAVDKMVEYHFLTLEHRAILVSGSTPKELIEKLEERRLVMLRLN